MALFSYQATDSAGNLTKGTLEASDEKAVVGKLQELGYFPVSVSPASSAAAAKKGFRPFSRRVSGRDVANFTAELKSLLEAGLPLDRSLSILGELETNDALKSVIADVYRGIHGGGTFAESLEKHPSVFPEIYVSVIRAGEAGGALDVMLGRLAKFLEDTQRLKDDLKSALMYPMILALAGGSAIIFMLLFVIPKFSVIFEDMGGAMPLPTLALLKASAIIRDWWWLAALIAAAGAFGVKMRLKTPAGRAWMDGLKLKLPVAGAIVKKSVISRFARTLGTLLQGGIPILEALKISTETMGNSVLSSGMQPVIDGVRRGRGLSAPLKEVPAFPALASHMLAVGEETGKIDEMLLRLADNYDREINTALKRMLSLIEPLIILLMAVVVGFIVISLLLAIFSINEMPM